MRPRLTEGWIKATWIATVVGSMVVYAATGSSLAPGIVLIVWGWIVATNYRGIAERMRSRSRLLPDELNNAAFTRFIFLGFLLIGVAMLFSGFQDLGSLSSSRVP